MLEIHLEIMQQTRLSRLKNCSDHVTQHIGIQNLTPQAGHNCSQNEIIRLQKPENDNIHCTLKFTCTHCKEVDHFSVLRNGNVQFPFFLPPIGPFVPYSMHPKGKQVHPRT